MKSVLRREGAKVMKKGNEYGAAQRRLPFLVLIG